MKLSPQTIVELQHLSRTTDIPDYGLLYVFFLHLLPGLKTKQLMNLLNCASISVSKEEIRVVLHHLTKHKVLRIDAQAFNTPTKALTPEQAKRWGKEERLSDLIKKALQSAQLILNAQCIPSNTVLPIRQLVKLLWISGHEITAWEVIENVAQKAPQLLRLKFALPPGTYQKARYLQWATDDSLQDASTLPQGLQAPLFTTVYRNSILYKLPACITTEQMKGRIPLRHDITDDISDICLLHALQTGDWARWDEVKNLVATNYQRVDRHDSYYTYHCSVATADIPDIASVVDEWKKGKWNALKKLKTIFYYNSAAPYPAELDIPLRAALAPLILMLRLKNSKTHADHVKQATEALREMYGDAVAGFIHNFYAAEDLEPKEYHRVEWSNEHPFELLPKALCLAAFSSMPNIRKAELDELCQACYQLHSEGLTMYSWYMANAILCIPTLTPEQTQDLTNILQSRTDLPPFCAIEKKADIFESMLTEIEQILDGSSAAQAQSTGFIRWKLIYQKRSKTITEVQAYVHKRLKSGKLSVGKRVFIAELDMDYEDYLTEQDKRIIQHIKQNELPFYYAVENELTESLAALLIGHPHITLSDKGNDTDIVLQGEPVSLHIKSSKGTITLSMDSKNKDYGIPIRHVRDNIYSIVVTTEKTKPFLSWFSKHSNSNEPISLPIQYQERLMRALSVMDDAVKLQGDIRVNKAAKVEAKLKAVAFLEPLNGTLTGKLMLELYPGTPCVQFYSTEKVLFAQCEGNSIAIQRDAQQEQDLRQQLAQACPTLFECLDETGALHLQLTDTMLQVVEELQHCSPTLLETRWKEGKALNILSLEDYSGFRVQSSSGANDWLSIGGEVQVNESLVVQLSELLQSINQAGGRFIELKDGHFLKLSKKIEEQLRTLSVLAGTKTKGKRAAKTVDISPALLLLLAQTGQETPLPQALQQESQRLLDCYQTPFNRPRNLNATLRDYQSEGYAWLQRLMNCHLGACLADDMGLGKTLQLLCVLLARAADGPSLVVAPASVCNNWSSEAAKFTPTLNIYQPENEGRAELIKNLGKRDVLVCSYGLLVTEAKLLTSRKWNVVVLDEAQYIKNSQTQRARTACELKAKCRIAATGTPIENSLDELWSIFDFINPGYLGTQELFRERFANKPGRRKLLHRIISPFVLRRLKGDVLDELPEKTETTLQIKLNETERALYEACRREAILRAENSEDRFTILAQLTRLRRLCCHPKLVDEAWAASSGKLAALAEMAEELKDSGHKALIFSQFTDMLALVREMFEQQGFSYLYLDGSTPKAKRGALVDAFQDGEADFFLISLKAGGTGLNLTAADYVILLDPWWNPAVEAQAADRTHRIGQKRPVTVCRFVCADTIEEKVMALHAEKRELFDQIINETGKAAALSITDLRELL